MVLAKLRKINQRFNKFVPPGHPEDVGDDGGEEGLEEQPAVLLAHRGLDHTECLHLEGFVLTARSRQILGITMNVIIPTFRFVFQTSATVLLHGRLVTGKPLDFIVTAPHQDH